MERLYNGNAVPRSCIVDGWGPEWKKILDMHDVKAPTPQLVINPVVRFTRPDGAQRSSHCAQLLYSAIVFLQQLDFMTVITQKSNFRGRGLLFTARYEIPVMEHEDFHLYCMNRCEGKAAFASVNWPGTFLASAIQA